MAGGEETQETHIIIKEDRSFVQLSETVNGWRIVRFITIPLGMPGNMQPVYGIPKDRAECWMFHCAGANPFDMSNVLSV